MRIVYLCADGARNGRGMPILGTKGSSVHVRSITEALQRRGHEVTLLCARLGTGNPDPKIRNIIETGASVSRIAAEMSRLLSTTPVDLVIERYALESGVAGRLCARFGVPHLLEVNAPIVLEAARHRDLTNVGMWLRREESTFRSTRFMMVVSSELERYVHSVAPDAAVSSDRNPSMKSHSRSNPGECFFAATARSLRGASTRS